MPDYAEMYRILFQSQTKAIEILQKAQQATEQMYMECESPALSLIQPQEAEPANCVEVKKASGEIR